MRYEKSRIINELEMKSFQVSEDDLLELESNLSLIYWEGMDWTRFNDRQDLREAWEMTIKSLSDIRFGGGPPKHVEHINAEPDEPPPSMFSA